MCSLSGQFYLSLTDPGWDQDSFYFNNARVCGDVSGQRAQGLQASFKDYAASIHFVPPLWLNIPMP